MAVALNDVSADDALVPLTDEASGNVFPDWGLALLASCVLHILYGYYFGSVYLDILLLKATAAGL